MTVIDRNPERISLVNTTLDAICVSGSVDIGLLKLAGAGKADLLIAATDSDEANILCCMVARKLGVGHTIARVRQAEHFEEVILLRDELGLSMLPAGLFAAAVTAAILAPDFGTGILMVLVSGLYALFSAFIGLAEGVKHPVFDWINEVQVVKQSVAVLLTMMRSAISDVVMERP